MQPSEHEFLQELERRKARAKAVIKEISPYIRELYNSDNYAYHDLLPPPNGFVSFEAGVSFEMENGRCSITGGLDSDPSLSSLTIAFRVPNLSVAQPPVLSCQRGNIEAFIEGDWPKHIKEMAVLLRPYRIKAKEIATIHSRRKYISDVAQKFDIPSPYPSEPAPPPPKVPYDWKRDIEELSYHIPKLIFISIILFLIWVAYKYAPH